MIWFRERVFEFLVAPAFAWMYLCAFLCGVVIDTSDSGWED